MKLPATSNSWAMEPTAVGSLESIISWDAMIEHKNRMGCWGFKESMNGYKTRCYDQCPPDSGQCLAV